MSAARHQAAKLGVVVVGPPLHEIGGMTSVVRQTLGLDFGGRFDLEFVPFTLSEDKRERWWHRGLRHVRQTRILRRAVRRANARIVHLHTCSAVTFYRSVIDMLAARHLGARTILHIHGAKFDVFYAKEPIYRRRLIRWALTRADRVIALSAAWAEKLKRIAPGGRIVVIENAVELSPLLPSRTGGGACRFLLLARMDDWKGIDDLLTACALVHQEGTAFQVTLAGPPGTAGDATILDAKIHRLGLDTIVRYAGPVQGRLKTELLTEADAYVQPSHHEGMPIALLEALSHGLPIVATSVGAVPEVIEHERQGVLVPPHHPEQLADAMRELVLNPDRRRSMSAAARLLAETRFSVGRFGDDLVALYDSLCRPASSSGLKPARSGGSKTRGAEIPRQPITPLAMP